MSTDPDKQRKRAANRPQHRKQQKLAAHLAEDLLLEFDTRSVPVRAGDTVEIMRGDFAGTKGEVLEVDPDETRITVEGATQTTAEEQQVPKPIHPSNVRITDLDLTDPWRARNLGTEPEEPAPEPEPELEAEPGPEPGLEEAGSEAEPEAEPDLASPEPETEEEADAGPGTEDEPEADLEEPEPETGEPEAEADLEEPEPETGEPEAEADEAEAEPDEAPETEAEPDEGSPDDTEEVSS